MYETDQLATFWGLSRSEQKVRLREFISRKSNDISRKQNGERTEPWIRSRTSARERLIVKSQKVARQ
jgi:hypothetical protein